MGKLNIIVATHGKFGEELVKSAEMIIGETTDVYSLSLLPEKSFEEFYEETKQIFAKLEGPTIALVDLFGGTPSNVLTALTQKYEHKVVSGLNLPLFIEVYMKATLSVVIDLEQLIEESQTIFKESFVLTNDRLAEE